MRAFAFVQDHGKIGQNICLECHGGDHSKESNFDWKLCWNRCTRASFLGPVSGTIDLTGTFF